MPKSSPRSSALQPRRDLPNHPAKSPDQLTVTRRGAIGTRQHPLNEWEFSKSGFNGQKRSKMNAIAIWRDHADIWPGVGLVNGGHKSRYRCF